MHINNIILRLSIILSETCAFFFTYYIIMGFSGDDVLVAPLLFFAGAAFIGLANIILSNTNYRIALILLIDLVLIISFWIFAYYSSGKLIFSTAVEPFYNVVLFHFTLGLLILRAIRIAYKKDLNVYEHFDFFIFYSLLLFLVFEFGDVAINNKTAWILIFFFFNILPLYIYNKSEDQKPGYGWFVVAFGSVLIVVSNLGHAILPGAVGAADTAFGYLKSISLFALNILVQIILFLSGLSKNRKATQLSDGGFQMEATGGLADSGHAWVTILMQVLLFLIGAAIILLLVTFIYYLIRKLISLMLRRQTGEGFSVSYQPLELFKEMLGFLSGILSKVFARLAEAAWILKTVFAFRSPVTIEKAYVEYLKWGIKKGYPRKRCETPNEYCSRLTSHYPILRDEIAEITDLFVGNRYSDAALDASNMRMGFLLRKMYLYNLKAIRQFLKLIQDKFFPLRRDE